MARYFSLILLLGWMFTIQAQQANNVSLLGNWDDNSLVTISGVQFNDIWGYAADGKEFAIIGSQQKVHFIDVTDPNQIVEIAAIAGGNNTIWRDMKTYGTHAYSVADQGSEGLLVFDLSNITNNTNPSVTLVDQQSSVFSRAHNVYIDTDHGFLYVAGSNAGGNADLLIYDLNTSPGSPTLLQSVDLPGNYIHDVYVKDHIAYCSHEGRGLYIYNLCGITDPSCTDGATGTWLELGRIDTYQFQGYNHSSWVKGNTIIFADETHGSPLTSADISDLSEIEILDYFQSNQLGVSNPTSPAGSVPHNPFILGNLLVTSYYHDGVVFYDLTDPANIQEVGYYDTEPDNTNYAGYDGCWGVYPFLPSGRIIASDVLNGLFVLEMSSDLIDLAVGDCSYTTIDSNDFEGGFGIWNDGGADCRLSVDDARAANSGVFCVRLRDNSSSSVMTTNNLNLDGYEEITIDFNFLPRSMESGEDLWLQVSMDGGASFTTVASWVSGTDFSNFNREFESVIIPGTFTSTTLFRFRCDASANNDIIYIDDIVISGCTNGSGLVAGEEQTAVMEEVTTTEIMPNTSGTSVFIAAHQFANLKLAPNPTRNQLNVSFSLSATSEMSLFVSNIAGQRMLSKTIKAETGRFELELNTTDYASGIYFLTLMTSDQQISQKFIVVE